MAFKYIKGRLMPDTAKNRILSLAGYSENELKTEVYALEKEAAGIIETTLNIDKIKETENGESVLSGICRDYVLAKLYSSLALDNYIDSGEDYMVSFRTTLRNLKDAQLEDGIEGDESKKTRNLFIR